MKNGRILKALASLRLAVFVLLSLGVVTAWGTFVEAKYDATAAQKLVYHSVWMYAIMILLTINLTAVMVDRWPWKEKHTGFVLAHIGIIILMIGSVVTRYIGIDGSMALGVGESSKHVVVGETDFTVYSSLDGSRYTKLFDREVDFFLSPPTPEKPIEVELPNGMLRVVEYLPYALRDQKIIETQNEKDGAAVRFQLQNPNVSVTDWLLQPGLKRPVEKDLGPARVVLTSEPFMNVEGRNTIVLRPKPGSQALEYEIHTASSPKAIKKGKAQPGDAIETGWMGLVLRVLKVMPHAKEELKFQSIPKPTPLSTAAIRIQYNDIEQWMSINALAKFFSDQAVYVVTYANRRIDVGFPLQLKEFRIGRYQGTMRAASYESVVTLPDGSETVISMNEPLKQNGYTFYQASFSEDEQGNPVASVLSVNDDPGRWIKYLGSLMIVLGTIHMFYFKRRAARNRQS